MSESGTGGKKRPRDPSRALRKGRVLAAFGAPWCPPWVLLQEPLSAIRAEERSVVLVDVDEFSALAEEYRIVALPTFLVLEGGQERKRRTGACSEGDLRELAGLRRKRTSARTEEGAELDEGDDEEAGSGE